jgi:multidrug efflux pump subunit AcrA (membrane-fusion protein)
MKKIVTLLFAAALTAAAYYPAAASTDPSVKTRVRQSQALPATAIPTKPVVVRTRTAGRVWEVYVKNGQHVEQGQTLLKMASDVQTPTHPGYQIDFDIAQLQYKKVLALHKAQKATPEEVAAAKAQVRMAKKMLNDGPQQLQFSFVSAPISGVLSGHSLVAGDQLQSNALVVLITAEPARKPKAARLAAK